jgi:hypothetical protein
MDYRPSRLIRLLVVVLGVIAWFATQDLIGQRPTGTGDIGDGIHTLTAPLHAYFLAHESMANGLLIASSFVIDLLGIFLLGWSIVGPSLRPFVGLFILFGLRQICQALCALPPPEGMIWRDPGFPSLLVTYGVANDFFFSGHSGIAVYGAIELARLGRRWLAVLATAIALFEVVTVLVLRAHYTMDVFAGVVTALFVACISGRVAEMVDRCIVRLWPGKTES